jgi:hypothetical protein
MDMRAARRNVNPDFPPSRRTLARLDLYRAERPSYLLSRGPAAKLHIIAPQCGGVLPPSAQQAIQSDETLDKSW